MRKPTQSLASAAAPGVASWRKAPRAAASFFSPSRIAAPEAFTTCNPWETPIANTRKGARIDMGSMPKPSSASSPSVQTTASAEHDSSRTVYRTEWMKT